MVMSFTTDPGDVIAGCWWHLAHRDLENREAEDPRPVRDRNRWLAARAARWRLDHADDARRILAARPDLGVEQLAEAVRTCR